MCLNGRPYVMTGLTASDNLNIWKLVPNTTGLTASDNLNIWKLVPNIRRINLP
jgi:hypothetical protein